MYRFIHMDSGPFMSSVSGSTTITLDGKELDAMVVSGKRVRELKTLLATRVGYSRFRLRLLVDNISELRDEILVSRLPSIQLIILGLYDAGGLEQLFCAHRQRSLGEVEQFLQRPFTQM